MLAKLQGMAKRLEEMLSSLDPALLAPSDAVAVLEAASAVERRAAAIKTLVAERAADAGTWSRSGHRTPEAWLSELTGTSYGDAAATLDTSSRLPELPVLGEAVRKGELSAPRLQQLASAARPDTEDRLLEQARRQSYRQLREACARERARRRSADEERARHERIHRERFHRSWIDGEGAYRYEGKTTAAVGARIDAAIAAEADRVFKQAWAEGRREPAGAYRADALANLVTEGGAGVDTHVVVRVDEARLAGGDGVCETASGPVPVEDAIGAILAGAFVKVVVRNGVDITRVAHAGRYIPVELRTAVFERDGQACVRPGCGASQRLEVHHWRVDHARGGATAYWNLATLCRHDHALVTHGGHRLDGGPGRWTWIPPPP